MYQDPPQMADPPQPEYLLDPSKVRKFALDIFDVELECIDIGHGDLGHAHKGKDLLPIPVEKAREVLV